MKNDFRMFNQQYSHRQDIMKINTLSQANLHQSKKLALTKMNDANH